MLNKILLLLIAFITISNVATSESLEKVIKNSQFMRCENNAFFTNTLADFGSWFPKKIAIYTYKNYLLIIDYEMMEKRLNTETIPKEVFNKIIIIRVLTGNVFVGYGAKLNSPSKGYTSKTNINNLTTFGMFTWFNEWSMQPNDNPYSILNDEFNYYLVQANRSVGVNLSTNFKCRKPNKEWVNKYYDLVQ